jgi:hypothetical protein
MLALKKQQSQRRETTSEVKPAVSATLASNGATHDLDQIPLYARSSVPLFLQRQSSVGEGMGEQEANRVSNEVVQMPALQTKQPHPPVTGATGAPSMVDPTSRSGGQPLDAGTKTFMESRFACDFGNVRIHHDDYASDLASSLDARAFTVGKDIYFGSSEYQPHHSAGRLLLAHELTHVLQQSDSQPIQNGAFSIRPTSSNPRIARTPNQTTPPQTRRRSEVEGLWRRFRPSMGSGTASPQVRERARTVLHTLSTSGDRRQQQTYGLELALWFHDRGMTTEETTALSMVEGAWEIGAALQQSDVPAFGLLTSPYDELGGLIRRAEQAARAGRHTVAFRLFGLAYLFLQMQLIQQTERRAATLEATAGAGAGGAAVASVTRAMLVYPSITQIYNAMRHILGFYLELERDAAAAGQTQRAAQFAAQAVQLHQHLRRNFTWSGRAMIAEVSRVQTRRGPSIRLHGANLEETDMTPFQGLPTPEEIGERNYQWQRTEIITESLSGQVQFLAELRRHPEIESAFRGQTIDMNNVSHRLRIWQIMLGVFRQQGAGPGALADLMGLIGRYLRAFTIHTQYNIRDWGQNYLTSDMPVDLAGRAERDCGVYALTVAYEVFRTARAATPRMNLQFEITVVPGHVVLAIYDMDNTCFYVVSNDTISPRHSGGRAEAEAVIAPAAAGAFGRRDYVTPAVTMGLGSTSLSPTGFRSQAWQRYLEATGWSLAPEQPSGPGDTRTPSELSEAGHRRFYERQEQFDRRTRQLGGILNILNSELSRLSDPDQLTRLQNRLPRLAAAARQLAGLFIMLGPRAPLAVDPTRPQLIPRLRPRQRYVFSWQPTGSVHPLARIAMALLRFQHLGGTLTPDDLAFITWCDSISVFHTDIDAYRRRGLPAGF